MISERMVKYFCCEDPSLIENYEEANKGKHHSEETKRKLSAAMKGKHWKLVDGKRVWY